MEMAARAFHVFVSVFAIMALPCLATNHSQIHSNVTTLLSGTWDLILSSDNPIDGPPLIQHTLTISQISPGSLVGLVNVVAKSTQHPVARWEIFLNENDSGAGMLKSTSLLDESADDFSCPFDLQNIAPGVYSSVNINDSTNCVLFWSREPGDSSVPRLLVEVCIRVRLLSDKRVCLCK